ncbi:MAG: peptide chain release factor N(5)-glutamine methyltransferase [Saprospiraceae bacterium]
MDWGTLKHKSFNALSPYFEEREVLSILRAMHEDLLEKDSGEIVPEKLDAWNKAISRIIIHEPVAYVTGVAFFFGLKLKVNPQVLIPRPETEELVDVAIKRIGKRNLRILDIGTGSGCIALAIKQNTPQVEILAIDISKEAVEVATSNAKKLNLEIQFLQMNILDKSEWKNVGINFDMIISNPPYIARSESSRMGISTVQYEPETALYADDDILIFYKAIAELSELILRPKGIILVEINEFLGVETSAVFKNADFLSVHLIQDLNRKDRMIEVQKH